MPSILITGGAGFIGVNTALTFFKQGWKVSVLDNLSRKGTDANLKWLQKVCDSRIDFYQIDIRDFERLADLIKMVKPDMLLHLAAQVAVTTSYLNPREDFEINALGSFNIMESIRFFSPDTFVLYASTNKVYGGMEDVPVTLKENGYQFLDLKHGVSEKQHLDFHSPYGCSKGVADQYVIDYARIYNLNTCSFRQSCIYGTRQFGIEDQGWVAWFTIAATLEKSITLYGDGWQTRDVLNVRDLAIAYICAWNHRHEISGEAFNIGGGPKHTLSLRDLLHYLESKLNLKITPKFTSARPGDQPVFVCDIRKAEKILHWSPRISVYDGVTELIDWVQENITLFS
jgi:CDP-paratose 2-epimerase